MKSIEQLNAIQKIQDYIENHLNDEITLKTLSRVAGYSPSHTERLFKELTDQNLFDYIRLLRLTDAAKTMREKKSLKIIDVSLNYLFDSHEGFTRAFSKEFGVSPKKYQKNPIPVRYFIPYSVLSRHVLKLKEEVEYMKSKTVFVQVVERPKRKAIIKRGIQAKSYFPYCEEVGCDVWGILASIPDALYEPVGFWLPKHLIKPNTSEYVQGVEVNLDYNQAIPEGFDVIELDACHMMIFQGEPYDDVHFMQEIGIVQDHIKVFDPKLYGYDWDDKYPSFQLEPQGHRGYIEAKPVKKI
ncbi:MAG: AraC family transcriptional regulator [Tenericutes bacterium]|nr:AraC family transcriptional regulator [Mycoplasmatota bacterium]